MACGSLHLWIRSPDTAKAPHGALNLHVAEKSPPPNPTGGPGGGWAAKESILEGIPSDAEQKSERHGEQNSHHVTLLLTAEERPEIRIAERF